MSEDDLAARRHLQQVIPRRPRVTPWLALVLAAGFAAVLTPTICAEAWLGDAALARIGEPAPVTVRAPALASFDPQRGATVIRRGELVTRHNAAAVATAEAARPTGGAAGGLFVILFVLAAVYCHHLRRSHRGRLLRVQLVHLGAIAGAAVAIKVALLLTPLSIFVVPVVLAAVVPSLVFDRLVGMATGVLAALTTSLLVPFDIGVTTVLTLQVVVAALLLPDRARGRWRVALVGSVAGALVAGVSFAAVYYLSTGVLPTDELAEPLASSWLAAMSGGLLAGALAVPLVPVYQRMVGEISHARLVALADLGHPMLRQIAERSPGTWQHSLAMANMAELAANEIGANGRLVRVGAYFHDLGKSLQPGYFVENLVAGEASPHDHLPPEVSCDAIFSHVTEGILAGRRAGLPERIIDFMHMHHGNGVLEYFWEKCQRAGNSQGLTVDDFRYPGVPPQTPETALLAICDAVEAASRTLRSFDEATVSALVQRIVYGKLHLGQLDESGLSIADLRKISDSLRETVKHVNHARIEYPWQRAESEGGAGPVGDFTGQTTISRALKDPRLDSLDVPRPPRGRTPPTSQAPGQAPRSVPRSPPADSVPPPDWHVVASLPLVPPGQRSMTEEPVIELVKPSSAGTLPTAPLPIAVPPDEDATTLRAVPAPAPSARRLSGTETVPRGVSTAEMAALADVLGDAPLAAPPTVDDDDPYDSVLESPSEQSHPRSLAATLPPRPRPGTRPRGSSQG